MHGRLPVPTPATLEILKGVPVAKSTAPFELTTPTGAAILKTITDEYSQLPAMRIEKIGYGAGKKDFKGAANVLRLVVGSSPVTEQVTQEKSERLWMTETNVDDMTPEIAGYVTERLIESGALDAYCTPILMKKIEAGATVKRSFDRREERGHSRAAL